MEAIGPAVGGVNRFTSWMAGVWMGACFLHSILMGGGVAIAPAPTNTPAQPANGSGDKLPEAPK
jgi:hypothetical protein